MIFFYRVKLSYCRRVTEFENTRKSYLKFVHSLRFNKFIKVFFATYFTPFLSPLL